MSVVAACSLINGIMMGADCRVTFRRPGREEVFADNCQKLFVIGNDTGIGFAGSLTASCQLLGALFRQAPKHRIDPVSLYHWLPRLFRYEYRRLAAPNSAVSFLVGSTIPSHGNIIERQAVVDLANYMFFSPERKSKTLHFSAIVTQLLGTPTEAKLIGIPVPRNLLFRLDSPDFRPQRFMPLRFVAVGSGESLKDKIAGLRDMIFASDVGNYHMEAFWLCQAMESFLKETDEKTVGGLFPMLKLEDGGVMHLGQSSKGYFPGGYDISLEPTPNGRWIQRNRVTGKEIPLLPPWEIGVPEKDMRFDDFRFGMFG